MEIQTMQHVIENYIKEVERSIRQSIIERDAGKMAVNENKAFFLLLPVLNGEMWTAEMSVTAISVGAMHSAFDAHDTIPAQTHMSTARQLTILAGDYFSGIHYKLLASLPSFHMIRAMSDMIGKINEMKAICHEQLPENEEQLRQAIELIETGCITEFFQAFGFDRYIPVVKAALPLVLLESDTLKGPLQHDASGRGIDGYAKKRMVNSLRETLHYVLQTADFLHPALIQEIRKNTAPLTGRLI